MFWSKLCKSSWNYAWNLAFPAFISPIVWIMCENFHYESAYFKELHNEQEYHWPTIYKTGAAVVWTITSHYFIHSVTCIYASLFFAVRFVVTFEKLAKTFQLLKLAIQDNISISFQFMQSHATHVNTNLRKYINSSKLIFQKIDLTQKYSLNFPSFQIKTFCWSFFIA